MPFRLSVLPVAFVLLTPRLLRAQSTGEPWQIVPQSQSSLVFARDGALKYVQIRSADRGDYLKKPSLQ